MTRGLHVHRWGGGGPLVLCLHSSGLSGYQWKRLADKAGPGYRFLVPDFLGCGQSPPSPNGLDFRYGEDVEQVVALLEEVAEPVLLLGHSYGGFIGLKCALQRPHQVRAMAFYEPVMWGGLASYRGVPIERVVERFDPEGYLLNRSLAGTEAWMERFIDYWNGPGSYVAMSEPQRRPMFAMGEKLYAEVKEVVVDPTPHTDYAPLTQPTLILHGTTSPPEVLAMKDILSQVLSDVQTACIPGGHMNPVRNPLPVNAHFELFLRRQSERFPAA
jgi:pimeloyl-ACP methyl ester carboxylesterase